MQAVGKKILLQNRSVARKVNKPLLINKHNQQLVATEPISGDLVGLPIEVLYRIFDYLDAQTILLSLQYVCRRLRDVSEKYDRYALDFENISMVQMWHVCRLVRPESVLSLNLSDGPSTPQGIEFFLSLINIRKFTRLRSLSIHQSADDIFHTILKYVHGCRSVESFSIHFRRASLFGRPDSPDDDYHGPSLTLLASAIAKSNLKTFKTNLPKYQIDCLLWPMNLTLQHLTIGNCTQKQYYMILQRSPRLRTLTLNFIFINRKKTLLFHISHPLSSLALLEQKSSITALKQILSWTPSLVTLKIIGTQSFDTFLLESTQLETFLHNNFNLLSRFHIFIRCSIDEQPFAVDALMASFQTPFWTEDKRWFFTCEPRLPDNCLFYSASMRTMAHPYTLYIGGNSRSNFDEINSNAEMMNTVGKLHFEPTKMQYFNSREKNITGQSFYPNVTILHLKFHDNWPSDGIEFVSSLIDMSRVTALELYYDRKLDSISDSIVHVGKLFKQAVNVSALVVFRYKCLYDRFKWEKLCSVIPHHVKHLSISASDPEDMKTILDNLKHLWSIRFQWPTGIISEDKGTCSREIINDLKMKKQNFKYLHDDFELQIWLSNA
ncbi:unnamed protein product [Rotaria socialis]|uniref:F-box domain-containing protein n=1 Tax=Rotaria socialis TaxID=392032 RepID=A0A818Q4J6_9BILA|nr:unnamed protein product [Rotaria socialis]CAF4427858.1 unnamed protein product [Rotaria socialis]